LITSKAAKTQIIIDNEKHSVILKNYFNRKHPQKVLYPQVKVLPRDNWEEDCQTNTSSEILETWQLNHPLFTHPLYLFSSCFGGKTIFLRESLDEKGQTKHFLKN